MHYSANPKNISQRPVHSSIRLASLQARCGGASFTRMHLIRSHDSFPFAVRCHDAICGEHSLGFTDESLPPSRAHQSLSGRITVIVLKSPFKLRSLRRQQSLAIAASRLALPFLHDEQNETRDAQQVALTCNSTDSDETKTNRVSALDLPLQL